MLQSLNCQTRDRNLHACEMPENTLGCSIKAQWNSSRIKQNDLWSTCQREDQPILVKAANFQREARSASYFSRDETDQCSTTDFVSKKIKKKTYYNGYRWALIEREGLLRSSIWETRNNATFQAEEKEAATHLRHDPGFNERSHGIQHPLFSRSLEYPLRPATSLSLLFQVRNRKRQAARKTTILNLKPQKGTVLADMCVCDYFNSSRKLQLEFF